jgi:succinoglycan biosynthesis protein ExoH
MTSDVLTATTPLRIDHTATAAQAPTMVEAFSQRLSLARLLMIVLVVYVHFPLEVPQVRSVADISPLEPAYIASATVLRFSVTILTIMSGLIMFAKGGDRLGMTTIWRKVRTLVVPFLFFNLTLVAALFLAQRLGLLSGQRLNLLTTDLTTWADATIAWSTRPVNYPLYFLRDLFVISVVAVIASPLIRRSVLVAIAAAILISDYNLDANLILRTPMLVAFLIGAALAIYKVPLDLADKGLPWFAVALLLSCLAHYYAPTDTTSLLVNILGGLTVWTFTSLVAKSTLLQRMTGLAKFAFPIYLIHGIILFGFLALGIEISDSYGGLALWLVLPLIITLVSALSFQVFRAILPRFASFVTGGRGA